MPSSHGEKEHLAIAAMSRRSFLKSTGLAVAGATAVDTGLTSIAASAGPVATTTRAAVAGPGPVGITLTVNGVERHVSIEPAARLVDVLGINWG